MGGKFDDASHYELYAMVEGAKPRHLSDAGGALMRAFIDLYELADEMKAHAERVKWKGEGADAFRNWMAELSKQTYVLANYSASAGASMVIAGQGASDVKGAMPKPDMMCYADEEKEKARLKNAEPNRQEAIKQIEKLDSYYWTASSDIAKLEAPNFPALPNAFVPNDGGEWETPVQTTSYAAGTSSGASAAHATPLSVADHAAVESKAAPVLPAEVSPHTPVIPDGGGAISGVGVPELPDRTNTAIDSVKAPPAPDTINRPSTLPPLQDVPNVPSTGPTLPPVTGLPGPRPVTAPPVGRTAPIPGPGQLGKLPPTAPSTPRPSSVPPRIPTNEGIIGGKRSVGQTNVPRLPRGMVVGEEPHSPMTRGPVGPGTYFGHGPNTNGSSGPGRRLGSEPGGVVDRPKGTNPAARSLPRSMVVGEERGVLPRGPVGAVHPVDGAHAPSGAGSGRRLASEPGGVTGGPRVAREGRSEFTQGGSGLVRGTPGPGATPHSNALSASGGQRIHGSRPDCPEEDKDTWSGGRRDTVPPVIE
ncbi:hypothetical protein GCM10010246_77980 [Streptomyces cuspidosporus]|uniref:Uncharacterized protein n=1 Tax=Streptomyces cuspidosporus TaxID=66882 RepID=A0ABN3H823_9ACTN